MSSFASIGSATSAHANYGTSPEHIDLSTPIIILAQTPIRSGVYLPSTTLRSDPASRRHDPTHYPISLCQWVAQTHCNQDSPLQIRHIDSSTSSAATASHLSRPNRSTRRAASLTRAGTKSAVLLRSPSRFFCHCSSQ
jgi:hypothetical protein